jgi:hypothetical protein
MLKIIHLFYLKPNKLFEVTLASGFLKSVLVQPCRDLFLLFVDQHTTFKANTKDKHKSKVAIA